MNASRLRTARRGLAAVAAAVLVSAAPAQAGPPPTDYTKLAGLSQPVHETERLTYEVRMHDGIELYVEVVKPKGDGAYPVILEASPYHGTLADREGTRILPEPRDEEGAPLGLTRFFAPRGFAVVIMYLRGTG